MADMSFTELRSRGDIWMDDADNFAFTTGSKDEAMRTAINDDHDVVQVIFDTDTVTTADTLSYDLDESYVAVLDVEIQAADGHYIPVASDSWEFIGQALVLSRSIDAGYGLRLKVVQKLYDFDQIPQLQQSYVLHSYCANLTTQLMSRKTGRFLRNQTTMAELVQKQRMHLSEADRLRKRITARVGTRS